MYGYFFGITSLLLLVVVLYFLVLVSKKQRSSIKDRREVRSPDENTGVISLNATLRNDILKEALDINLRQVQLNDEISSGRFSENVEDALLKLDLDRNNNIRRSVEVGLLPREKDPTGINQQST